MFMSCKACRNVIDLDNAPVTHAKFPPTDGRKSYVQDDVMCPQCGGLVLRKIDGEVVRADEPDPRDEIPAADMTPSE